METFSFQLSQTADLPLIEVPCLSQNLMARDGTPENLGVDGISFDLTAGCTAHPCALGEDARTRSSACGAHLANIPQQAWMALPVPPVQPAGGECRQDSLRGLSWWSSSKLASATTAPRQMLSQTEARDVLPHTCPSGTSCIVDGVWSPADCSSADECTPCPPGSVGTGIVDCIQCVEPGKKANADQTACESCSAGSEPADDRSACETCVGTTFSTFGIQCSPCLARWLSTLIGQHAPSVHLAANQTTRTTAVSLRREYGVRRRSVCNLPRWVANS